MYNQLRSYLEHHAKIYFNLLGNGTPWFYFKIGDKIEIYYANVSFKWKFVLYFCVLV